MATRGTPGCRANGGIEVWITSPPPPVDSQALQTEESASPVRNGFQDWKLLQKALTFQSEMEDEEEEDAGAARSEAENAKKCNLSCLVPVGRVHADLASSPATRTALDAEAVQFVSRHTADEKFLFKNKKSGPGEQLRESGHPDGRKSGQQ